MLLPVVDPELPVNMSTTVPPLASQQSDLSNAVAPLNMLSKSVTLVMSQFDMSWLNASAPLNVESMLVTLAARRNFETREDKRQNERVRKASGDVHGCQSLVLQNLLFQFEISWLNAAAPSSMELISVTARTVVQKKKAKLGQVRM